MPVTERNFHMPYQQFQPPQTKLETYEIKPATFEQKHDFEAIFFKNFFSTTCTSCCHHPQCRRVKNEEPPFYPEPGNLPSYTISVHIKINPLPVA
jgi:hypothetical protein